MANRRRQSASDIAKALKCDPFKYLAERFNGMPDGKDKDGIALELLPYIFPKLKAVDASVNMAGTVTVTIGATPPNEVVADE